MAAAQHGNGFDPKRTKECVDRIEALAAKKASLHMTYMAECAVINEDIGDVYEEAKTAWHIPKKALKTVVKARATERKLEAMRNDLDLIDRESFDQIRHALGDLADTPLGDAALAGKDDAKGSKGGRGARKDRDAALDAVSTGNGAELLATGISKLN
ncbi:hypothetical protein [Methylobacterium radiodurans]|uniref:Uncharacterized protein n=1 Tax=Methylobacterium radiodurans TaxID=2202828 RepID=A0A2U8VQL5_9HYPH|nr:hypothetical protein [Methylobacterium radiodurans]AWN35758.1 hypothetical protein DK427_08375 [Methylobacterium radiodurans]